jgi:hypothetical protein
MPASSVVVVIDMQVAGSLHRDVDPGMAGQQVEHMVENRSRSRSWPAAVEVDGHRYIGFLGGALDRCLAHRRCLRSPSPALYQGPGAPATAAMAKD